MVSGGMFSQLSSSGLPNGTSDDEAYRAALICLVDAIRARPVYRPLGRGRYFLVRWAVIPGPAVTARLAPITTSSTGPSHVQNSTPTSPTGLRRSTPRSRNRYFALIGGLSRYAGDGRTLSIMLSLVETRHL